MIRAWLAIAILAGSWLFGLSFYATAVAPLWITALLLGAGLAAGVSLELPSRRVMATALALVVLPVFLFPWPYRAGPLLLGAGLAVAMVPQPRCWLSGLARGLVAAGVVLLAQSVAVLAYLASTSRNHDLPGPLVEMLSAIVRLLGSDATATGSEIALRTFRQVHRLAATWDLLADPASLWFLVGAWALLGLVAASGPYGLRSFLAAAGRLTLLVAAWLPLRAALLIALFLDREQRFVAATTLHVMNHFFSPWVQLSLVLIPALAAWRLVRLQPRDNLPLPTRDKTQTNLPLLSRERAGVRGRTSAESESLSPTAPRDRVPLAVALVALAAALFTVAVCWDPPGQSKPGRVAFVERHSNWEPSTRPYDTDWYGEDSGYNYAACYDYCSRWFEMSHLLESEAIDDRRLAACDVLVIKTPTVGYEPEEVAAVLRFVKRGGGLLLIGEHTNYKLTSSHLNDITRPLGFVYRPDLLFGPDVAYDQLYQHPAVPHPVVQRVPPMDFAVSCSIDPGTSQGRAVIASTGLWSLPPDYNMENYFPVPHHDAQMRSGAFIQLWAVRHGQGRVLAFTDSTIFSNFSIFEPGKIDFMLGMLAWLNQTNTLVDLRNLLLVLALLPLAAAAWLLWLRPLPALLLISAAACSVVLAGQAVAAAHRWQVPAPEQKRPMTRVIIDRTVSEVPLARGGFTDPSGQGYGLLEQWTGRLGYFPARREGPATFSGAALVVICPSRSVPDWYRDSLTRWVEAGGKLLVLDSPENAGSTANSLLWPFKLSLHPDRTWKGQLLVGAKPDLTIERAVELSGGQTVARIGDHPVAVWTRRGKGAVLAVGFASLWNDRSMGQSWNVEPDKTQRSRYDLFFKLLRDLVAGRPIE